MSLSGGLRRGQAPPRAGLGLGRLGDLTTAFCILALAAACLVLAPRESSPAQLTRAAVADIAWLAGDWKGEQGTATIEERWTPPSGGAMLAVARTVAAGRMTAFEFLRIVERNGGLVYVAQPNGRPPVEFVLTELGPGLAVFENPAHDFPQKVRYVLQADGSLEAQVSAPGREPLTFRFTRAVR